MDMFNVFKVGLFDIGELVLAEFEGNAKGHLCVVVEKKSPSWADTELPTSSNCVWYRIKRLDGGDFFMLKNTGYVKNYSPVQWVREFDLSKV